MCMVVLLTDFGDSEYVGVVKAVIYRAAPQAGIVDLCHSIGPQSVIEAAWVLKCNYRYFPKGSTFCCVVDPGVGTERRALAARTESYYFVGPDNGLLWEALKEQDIVEIRHIPIPADAARTFHGRDVFAKAAAQISLGNFNKTGRKIRRINKLEFYKQGRKGVIVRIDSFGNIVTNLEKQKKKRYSVVVAGKKHTLEYYPDYYSAKPGQLFLIEGSGNTLEISLKQGNANQRMGLIPGQGIEIS